jgi:hypothetical protein
MRNFGRKVRGIGVIIFILNIGALLFIAWGIRYLIENRNDIAKDLGKATKELKENFDAGRNESDSTYVVDSLNVE